MRSASANAAHHAAALLLANVLQDPQTQLALFTAEGNYPGIDVDKTDAATKAAFAAVPVSPAVLTLAELTARAHDGGAAALVRSRLSAIGLDALRARALQEVSRAPAWLSLGAVAFVHGGFHPAMLHEPPPPPLGRVDPLLSRALFGETTGRMQADGYPERVLRWVDRLPQGLTVYCGHDQRSTDGRPYVRHGSGGGTAVFLDTGAGKGGHLSWIDLPAMA